MPAALGWLARVFGFEELRRDPTPNGMHAEMSLHGHRIMMGQGGGSKRMLSPRLTAATQGIFVYLPDVDGHYARAQAEGAEIGQPIADLPYGRSYTAYDLDGHPWFFTTPPIA